MENARIATTNLHAHNDVANFGRRKRFLYTYNIRYVHGQVVLAM